MNKKNIERNLKQTEIGYDLIAKKFSETRKFFWRSLEFIKEYTSNGDNILDFGCGNGRLLELFKDKNINYKGVDTSQELINFAKKQYPESSNDFIKISPTDVSLPFNSKEFNSIYSIAVFHHLPGKNHRRAVAEELKRVLKKDGYIIITAWDLWQSKYRKNVIQNWFKKLIGKSKLDWRDCQISFTDNEGQVFERYHHAFTKKEIKKLFVNTGFKVINVKKIAGNIVLIGQKKD